MSDPGQQLGPLPAVSCVLMVDDEPINLKLLEAALRGVPGLRTVATTSPFEVEALYRENRPDLVLLDLHLPGMDGVEVMERLQALTDPDDFVPVMVLTADVSRESREAVLRAGAHDFLVKPLDPTEVALRVTNLLRTRELHLVVQRNRADLAQRLEVVEEADRAERERIAAATRTILDIVDRHAVRIVYQPIVELATGRTVGYEALSRFTQEPVRSPDLWFAEARALELGRELEFMAISEAMSGLERIESDQFLTMNLSPQWVASGAFADFTHGRSGERTVIEFTEHTRIDDYRALVEQMATLRARGYTFAVDDAGAGFASLHHILKISPEWIKLDIELTRGVDEDPARRALAASLVYFAGEVGARVISEGVETAEELAALEEIGVGYAQGYHLGRPTML